MIDKILVEVYGEWSIRIKEREGGKVKGVWSEAFVPSDDIVREIEVEGVKVKVTTSEHELSVFALEGRWNALHKLKKQIEEKNQQSLF